MAEKKTATDPKPDKPSSIFWTFLFILLCATIGRSIYNANLPDPPPPPPCVGSQLMKLNVGDDIVGDPLSKECTTGWIRVQPGSIFYVDTGVTPDLHYVFSDDSIRHVTPKLRPGRKFPTDEFRIWGTGIPHYRVLPKNI